MDNITLIKYAQNGDETALEKLVCDNTNLVWSIVRRFNNKNYEKDDLFQIGVIGLIKSVKRFDLSLNLKFSTYAVPMIIGEIKRYIRDDGYIKISRNLKQIASKARYVQDKYIKEKGEDIKINELCKILNVDEQSLIMALESTKEIKSIYNTVNNDENNPMYLIDKISDNNNFNDIIIDKIMLNQLIQRLDNRDKKIIILRYFKDKTQSEVADIIGISQVQVSRIEKKTIEKIKKWYSL